MYASYNNITPAIELLKTQTPMAEHQQCPRVLSIQSTVVSGYVGTKSATFPLQLLGFDVCNVNSVQLSNHMIYGKAKGQRLTSFDLMDLYEGLKSNNLQHFTHILSGYAPSRSFLDAVATIVKEQKTNNDDIIYVCDPVMGDEGKMYADADLLSVYRDVLTPLADIITPNQFEAELLTGMKIRNEYDAIRAAKMILYRGARIVVLTSVILSGENNVLCLIATMEDEELHGHKIQLPLVPAQFSGTGDLFAALLMAWLHKDRDMKVAFEKTLSTVQHVIEETFRNAISVSGADVALTPLQAELQIIQSKSYIENPRITHHSVPIRL